MDNRRFLFQNVPTIEGHTDRAWISLLQYRFDNEEYKFDDVLNNQYVSLKPLLWLLSHTIEEDHEKIYQKILQHPQTKIFLQELNLDFIVINNVNIKKALKNPALMNKVLDKLKNKNFGEQDIDMSL